MTAPSRSQQQARRRAARAASFNDVADVYAKTRPGYPAELVLWALEPALQVARAQGRPVRVVDLAAGTGQIVDTLVQLDNDPNLPPLDITAVEPLPKMRQHILDRYSGDDSPRVTVLDGRSDAMPLADQAADAVFVGTALHWMEDSGLAEVARVIKPGGVIAPLLNMPDSGDTFVAGYQEKITGANPAERFWRDGNQTRLLSAHFDDLAERSTPYAHPIAGVAGFEEFLLSYGAIAQLSPPEQQAKLAEARRFVGVRRPELAEATPFGLPHVTVATRARLRAHSPKATSRT